MTGSAYAMRTPLRGLFGKGIARLPEGPSESDRAAARFTLVCDARTPTGTRRGVLRGHDVYGLTSKLIAEGATRMGAADFSRSGALAPAQAFDPREFVDALEPYGISVELEPV